MDKRRRCIMLAFIAAFVFTLFYFSLFRSLDYETEIKVVNEETESESQSQNLYWIQLGVFKKKDSYESLLSQCESLGLSVIEVAMDEKTVLVVGCSDIKQSRDESCEQIRQLTEDYLLKEMHFDDENAIRNIQEKRYKIVLEEYVYQK